MMKAEEINYVVNVDLLRKGDILLINCYNERYQERMGSIYTHAALYAGDALILESDGSGVVLNHLFSYGFKDPNDVVVLRYEKAPESIMDSILFYARSTMGMEFGAREATRVPELEKTEEIDESNRMFCSRLVAQSYNKLGIKLVPNPNYCKPSSFLESPDLTQLDNPVIPADDVIRRTVSAQSKVREDADNVVILGSMFETMSSFYGSDIQTLEQLLLASVKDPSKDDEALRVLRETDYYTKRYDGRSFYCINDKEAFEKKYEPFERRVWFLMNQNRHLEKTYIPCITANVLSLTAISQLYPESKVIRFFLNHFAEQKNELDDYLIWVQTLLLDIIDNYPKEFERVIYGDPE